LQAQSAEHVAAEQRVRGAEQRSREAERAAEERSRVAIELLHETRIAQLVGDNIALISKNKTFYEVRIVLEILLHAIFHENHAAGTIYEQFLKSLIDDTSKEGSILTPDAYSTRLT
jgi:hypothetical protein